MGATAPPELPALSAPDIDRCVGKQLFDKTFSAAACVASRAGQVFHRATSGTLRQPPPLQKAQPGLLFDLGSLTQPLGAGLAALYLVSRNRLDLGARLSQTVPALRRAAFSGIELGMLLDHSAGFGAEQPYWEALVEHDRRADAKARLLGTAEAVGFVQQRVAATPLAYTPGTQCCPSDTGFMVLGWVIEHVTGKPLDLFLQREIFAPLGLADELFFIRHDDHQTQARIKRRQLAATEQCGWRKRLLQGEVHDANAWALGGVAGHAGLFGTVEAVWRLSHILWACFKGEDRTFLAGAVRRFWTRSRRVPQTTRALAWDTPSANDPSAKRYSRNTVGHLGSTGGSIWIDLSSDVIGVIATNAVHPSPGGKETALAKFRARMYDLIASEGESLPPDPQRGRGAAAFS